MVNTAHETPTQDTHDFYIGRTILGSEPIVNDLIGACSDALIVSFDGLLVLPLMPRRMLNGHADPIGELIGAFEELQNIHSTEEVISVSPESHIVNKSYSGASSVHLPYTRCAQKSTIQDEAACLRRTLDPPFRKGMPVVLRILETKRSVLIPRALDVVLHHFNAVESRQFKVSPPQICAVTKK